MVGRVAERGTRTTEPQDQPRALTGASVDLRRKTYLTVAQAMEYLEFPSEVAVRSWAQRWNIPKCRTSPRGQIRFFRADLDAWMQKHRQPIAM